MFVLFFFVLFCFVLFCFVFNSFAAPTVIATEEEAAADLGIALKYFFSVLHTELNGVPVYLATESYGGKYAPFIADMMIANGWNLKGIAVGNGFVNPYIQVEAFAPWTFAHGFAGENEAATMASQAQTVQSLIARRLYVNASDAYENVLTTALNAGGWFNPSSPLQFGFPDYSNGENWIEANRKNLGVPSFVPKFEMCNDTVNDWFNARQMVSVAERYAKLLDGPNKLPVLFFNGNLDFTVSTIGVEAWLADLSWTGQKNYLNATRTVWRYSPTDPFAVAGYVRQSSDRRLTLVSVVNAGHSVCQDQQMRSREVQMRIFLSFFFFFFFFCSL